MTKSGLHDDISITTGAVIELEKKKKKEAMENIKKFYQEVKGETNTGKRQSTD